MTKFTKSVHAEKVIDNINISMVEAFAQLLPHGKTFDMAVGYFFLSGYEEMESILDDFSTRDQIRVIMGNRTDYRTAKEIDLGIKNKVDELHPKQVLLHEINTVASSGNSKRIEEVLKLRDLISIGKLKIKNLFRSRGLFSRKSLFDWEGRFV
ncbi:MAG: hypothetical protein ACOX2P_03625 [Bacillota bacterium]